MIINTEEIIILIVLSSVNITLVLCSGDTVNGFFNVSNVKFVFSHLQPGHRDGMIQCFIKRDKSNLTYHLFLCLSPGRVLRYAFEGLLFVYGHPIFYVSLLLFFVIVFYAKCISKYFMCP